MFSKGGKWRNQAKQTGTGTKFQMVVEDVREGVLVILMFFPSFALHHSFSANLGILNNEPLKTWPPD